MPINRILHYLKQLNMNSLQIARKEIDVEGFFVINEVFSEVWVDELISLILKTETSKSTFKKTNDLFAIRQFFKEVPSSFKLVFSDKFKSIITAIFGKDYFVAKSIYFDKPENSNWFVAYHQDLTISVDKKIPVDGFDQWTIKKNQFAVQPPVKILEDNFTIRIHLDNTTEENGALKVLPKSHLKGIHRITKADLESESEKNCCVRKGGIMIMRPLLFHASNKTTNNAKRRIIHIEFSRSTLPSSLQWSELKKINN